MVSFLKPTKPVDDLKNVFKEKKKNPLAPLNPKQLSKVLSGDKTGTTLLG